MKILIIDNSAMNRIGNSYFTNSLNGLFVNDLLAFNYQITYFQFALETQNTISFYNLSKKSIKCYPLKPYKNKLIKYINAYIRVIPRVINNDFIYLYYPTSFKYTAFLCMLLKKKYGLYIRGMQGLNDIASSIIYKNAYTIFTVSDYFTNHVNKIVKKNIAHTIRPMIPFTEKDIVEKRNYKAKEKYQVLYLGRIAFDKGIEELLNAVKILNEKNYSFELNIVGNGEFLDEAKKIANNLRINDIVSFRGTAFEAELIKSYYLSSDIYILPTYHEGFPRTLYEAMIFGTPIITTFVGGISSLMVDGDNCKEIKPKSIDSIVEGLEFAFNNYLKMIEFAKNATKIVEKVIDSKRLTHAQHLNQIITKDVK